MPYRSFKFKATGWISFSFKLIALNICRKSIIDSYLSLFLHSSVSVLYLLWMDVKNMIMNQYDKLPRTSLIASRDSSVCAKSPLMISCHNDVMTMCNCLHIHCWQYTYILCEIHGGPNNMLLPCGVMLMFQWKGWVYLSCCVYIWAWMMCCLFYISSLQTKDRSVVSFYNCQVWAVVESDFNNP